ncbi:MAG: nucleoid-associated protein [Acidobacteriota bacterium]|jgi:nucleoid-associated protein YejK
MRRSFEVEHVAIHLVDRTLDDPRYSQAEVDLARFAGANREAIDTFFDGHLNRAWEAEEGERTRAAILKPGSVVGDHFKALQSDRTDFFERSKKLADRLQALAKPRNTTRGLLMVLWFRMAGDDRRFLGLFKMDPGSSDLITLREDDTGQYLLDLAVEHVEQVLPGPETGVLKWAILPHPTRPTFQAKLKDHEGDEDVALYFQDFLGCEPRLSARKQVHVLVQELAAYAEQHHADEDWHSGVNDTLEDLKQKDRVTLSTVKESLRTRSGLRNVDTRALQQRLRRVKAADLDFSGDKLRVAKLRYILDNGIKIYGSLDVMQSAVTILQVAGGYEFVVRAGSYREDHR